MTLKTLLVAAGAASLIAGAAYAQSTTGTEDTTGTLPHTVMGTNNAEGQSYASQLPNDDDKTATVVIDNSNGLNASMTTTPAYSATTVGTPASTTGATVTTRLVTNGPVPDTAENRAKYGQPLSRAGKRTAPAGN